MTGPTQLNLFTCHITLDNSDFIWPFLPPYMGVIPNPKMAFIFPISCNLALIFPIFIKYFPKCSGKGSFPRFQIKSLDNEYMRCDHKRQEMTKLLRTKKQQKFDTFGCSLTYSELLGQLRDASRNQPRSTKC